MNSLFFVQSSSFLNLPQDLKSLIFEFLPLSNYSNLQLVCRNFYYVLNTNPELWAKHLYCLFLDPQINKDFVFSEDLFEERPIISKEKIRFESMSNSRKVLETYYSLKEEWQTFLQSFLPSSFSQELTQEVFACLRTPNYPTPCLKKDIHFHPTKTMFQNFLTEIHFGLQGRTFMKDRKQFLIETVVDHIKASLSKIQIDANKLLSLRWYLFEKGEVVTRNKNFSNTNSTFGKRISKVRSILRNGKIHTFFDRVGRGEIKSFKLDRKIRVNFLNGHSKENNRRDLQKNSRMEIEEENNDNDPLEINFDNNEVCPNLIEKFYKLIQKLIRNHCHMLYIYLKTINDSQLLLNEYMRFWAEFVLIIIDLNKVLLPYSDLFNEIYNIHCQGYPNFPEFSIWRVLIKLWLNEVYSPLQNSLQKAFLSILMDLRVKNSPAQINNFQYERSLLYMRLYKHSSNCYSENNVFSQFNEYTQNDIYDQEKEKTQNLLSQFYQVICDLSYDEFTIFYSNCIPVGNETPKGMLDALILADTQKLYGCCKEILVQEPNHITNFFKSDIEFNENLFGGEIGCKLKENQMKILKEFLTNSFHSALTQYETSSQMINNNVLIFQSRNEGPNHLLLSNHVILLQIQQETCQKINGNQTYREGLTKVLMKNCPTFNFLLNFLNNLNENLECQYKEFEDACNERYRRGFTLIDEKYDSLFAFNKNPSSVFINAMKDKLGNSESKNGFLDEVM